MQTGFVSPGLPWRVSKWESEREIADSLRDLTAKVRKLQDEIRGDALTSRRPRGPHLPIDDERRLRHLTPKRRHTPDEPRDDHDR